MSTTTTPFVLRDRFGWMLDQTHDAALGAEGMAAMLDAGDHEISSYDVTNP